MYTGNDTQKIDILMVLAVSTVMFFLTLFALASVGFVPSYIDGVYPTQNQESNSAIYSTEKIADSNIHTNEQIALSSLPQLGDESSGSVLARPEPKSESVEPGRIVIHSIGVDLPVLNPTDTDIAVLDEALLAGTVRYPSSGKLNEDGNIFIFGHSSSIAFVKNPMYKAFNRLSELREGDTVKLAGNGEAHIYRVKTVRRTDVDDELVDLSLTPGKKLTLSTCDFSLGDKSSRFVVEADFIGSYKDQ